MLPIDELPLVTAYTIAKKAAPARQAYASLFQVHHSRVLQLTDGFAESLLEAACSIMKLEPGLKSYFARRQQVIIAASFSLICVVQNKAFDSPSWL